MEATDLFRNRHSSGYPNDINDPSSHQFIMQRDDNNELPYVTREFYLSAPCAMHYLDAEYNEITVPDTMFAVGVPHALRIRKLFDTDTTPNVEILGVV